MRPIEFRGINRCGGWVYGMPLLFDTNKDKKEVMLFSRYIAEDGMEHQTEWVVNRKTIGQYTGLKDKHGTKIFEGDIIASHGYTHIIEYEEQQARFVATRFEFSIVSKDSCSLTKLWIDECDKVVVGNIHER